MPESLRMWIEISFNTTYLIVIWGLVWRMGQRRAFVKTEDQRTASLVRGAFTLLALGDTGHVGFRVIAYLMDAPEAEISFGGMEFGLLGTGNLMTAVTITLFYVMLLAIWRYRFDKKYGPLAYVLLASALIRLVMLAMPVNQWDSVVPPQPWATIRNLPLTIQGLGVAYLLLKDGQVRDDRNFWWIGVMILVSYGCYLPVILFVQQIPVIGMLMIPKTVAYVVMGFLAYNELYETGPTQPAQIKGASVSTNR